jgi:hypothetical protein
MPSIVNTFAEISDQYDVAFVDLGCMHNGITPFQASVDAMQSYRERGGKVVLVTNSRVRGTVLQQLLTWNGALPEPSRPVVTVRRNVSWICRLEKSGSWGKHHATISLNR